MQWECVIAKYRQIGNKISNIVAYFLAFCEPTFVIGPTQQQERRMAGISGKRLLLVLVLWGFILGLTQAAIMTTGPLANWQSVLGGLVAGDTLYFQPGTYSYSNYLGVSLNGSASAPITVTGYKNTTRPIFAINANQNIFNLVQGNYVIFDYLEFSGLGGTDGSTEGLRLGSPTSVVSNSIFQNLLIHDTGSSGFTANYANGLTYENLTIVHNEVRE